MWHQNDAGTQRTNRRNASAHLRSSACICGSKSLLRLARRQVASIPITL